MVCAKALRLLETAVLEEGGQRVGWWGLLRVQVRGVH